MLANMEPRKSLVTPVLDTECFQKITIKYLETTKVSPTDPLDCRVVPFHGTPRNDKLALFLTESLFLSNLRTL